MDSRQTFGVWKWGRKLLTLLSKWVFSKPFDFSRVASQNFLMGIFYEIWCCLIACWPVLPWGARSFIQNWRSVIIILMHIKPQRLGILAQGRFSGTGCFLIEGRPSEGKIFDGREIL